MSAPHNRTSEHHHEPEAERHMRRDPEGTSGYVETNGVRLHHLQYGDGEPTIMVLPGITSPAITWEFVAEELAGDARIVILDIRGRGLSDAPETGYALTDYAADAAGVIEALGLERPVILGHSMGARIAAALGALYPDAVGPLIIADPPLSGPGRGDYATPLESFRSQLHEAYAGTTAEAVLRFYTTWSKREAQIRAEWLSTCAEHAVVQTWELFSTEDFFAHWRRLRPPLLFVHGEDSPVVTPDGLADVVAANPAADVVGIEGAGHMIPWENLADFVAAVRGFVAAETQRGTC
jgi:N-formylmaleamate deformylase